MIVLRPALVMVVALLSLAGVASAAGPSVTAVLSSSDASIGQMVQMQVRVTGERSADLPAQIAIDGLQIQRTGTEQHFEMNNFNVTSSVVYNYTILPERAGTFKIPSQLVKIGGATLRTPELTLRVAAGASRSGNASRQPGGPETKLASAELLFPTKTAYVGEAIPLVFRFIVPARTKLTGMAPPELDVQGFTLQKLREPEVAFEEIGGRTYQVHSWKSAITPTRPGKFQIGPMKMKASALVPRRHINRSPFDLFGSNDPFDSMMDPFSMMGEPREISAVSDTAQLEVKALPTGAPPSFNGAVGNFTLSSEANPKRIALGDPITIKSTISGRGSFDRVEAPVFPDDKGWHKYPATGSFKQDDDVGISGAKNFEMVVSPNEKKTTLPPLVFSFFDPTKDKYVTLQSEAVPLVVEGGTAPTIAAAAPAPSPSATANTTTAREILPQYAERGPIVHSFAPLYATREFWLAQLIPLAAVAAIGGTRFRRARRLARAGDRHATWLRQAEEGTRRLQREKLGSRDYFAEAAHIVQLRTAARLKIEPATVDAKLAADAFALEDDRRQQVAQLFAQSDELRYSGGSGNGAEGGPSSEERTRTLSLIESLRK